MNIAVEKEENLVEKSAEVKETTLELPQDNRKEMIEQTKESNELMQQTSRASKIIDSSVKNFHGYDLGEIKDLVIDPETGHIVYAVISFGGVFGLGDKLFSVPWKALRWTGNKTHYTLDIDKTTLEKAPGFDKNHWPDSSSKWDQQRKEVDQFYRVNP
jgi:sporulation protein YlmC with PRC-barrel domain